MPSTPAEQFARPSGERRAARAASRSHDLATAFDFNAVENARRALVEDPTPLPPNRLVRAYEFQDRLPLEAARTAARLVERTREWQREHPQLVAALNRARWTFSLSPDGWRARAVLDAWADLAWLLTALVEAPRVAREMKRTG